MDDTPLLKDSMAVGYGHEVDRLAPVRWYKNRNTTAVLRSANAVAPWSNWVRDSLIRDYGVDPARVEVIPPGIDLSRWRPNAERQGSGPLRILFVGGEFERKGGPLLLRAFANLPPGRAELHLVTKSDVPPRPGVVVHSGLSPNDPALTDLFTSSDVFVLPSRWEMFGIAAIEAAAAGLPVIVTKVGGLRDLVVDGVTGFAVDPDDGVALAERLERLLDDPVQRRRMGAAARARAEREFDATTNAQRLVGLAMTSAGVT
jgi:glycosyltransferase involved in cell wall biosynthesis